MQRQVPKKRQKGIFALGVFTGFLLTVAIFFGAVIGALTYVEHQGQNNAVFAVTKDTTDNTNRVQLYFPLERFLQWRSTPQLALSMKGDTVHVRLSAQVVPQFHFRVAVDIAGVPSVSNGYFTLQNVSGAVDHIPVPTTLLLGAIAMDGAHYGIQVNDAKDTLYVEKTFGSYRLAGYDAATRDLIISLPIQTVEQAARGQSVI